MAARALRGQRLVHPLYGVAESYSLKRCQMAEVASKTSKGRTMKKAVKKKPGTRRGAKKRVSKKRKIDTKKKSARKKATRKKAEKNKAKKKANKKVVKKKPAKKTTSKKAKKKTAKRKLGRKKRSSGKKVAGNVATPPMSNEGTRLAIAVRETEQALEKTSKQLAEARERFARAATTARLKRTQAAHAAADRAREEVALVNERRVTVGIRLREARDAIGEQHKADLDWHKLEHALKETVERYGEALNASDRRVDRAREGRNRQAE